MIPRWRHHHQSFPCCGTPSGEVACNGRLRVVATPGPEALHQAIERETAAVLTAIFNTPMSGSKRRRLYTGVAVEDEYDRAIELLGREGWSESDITAMGRSLITDEKPPGK